MENTPPPTVWDTFERIRIVGLTVLKILFLSLPASQGAFVDEAGVVSEFFSLHSGLKTMSSTAISPWPLTATFALIVITYSV